MKTITTFVAAVLMLGATLSYAQVDRSQKPAPGPLPKSAVPPFKEFTLKNGLRVVIVEDHKQPLVYFRTLILSGNAQDGANNGAAAAVSALLEKGTKKMSADEIAKKLDFYGASLGAGSSVDDINVSIGCMKRDMDNVLSIYADVIKNPTFPADELEKYKSETLSGLKASRQSPVELGRKMGRLLTYGLHPYGMFQTDSTVKALTVDAIKQWHQMHFCGSNAIIAVVGDITEKEIKPVLEKQFGDWNKGTYFPPSFPIVQPTKGTTISLVDRPGSAQSTVRLQHLGLASSNPDYDRASLVMSIFAGNGVIGFQNRLFQNIREKHGYTYTPGGSLTRSIDPGVMVAVAEVRNSVTDSALDQMLMEYKRLSTEPISESELNFAKGLIAGKFMMDLAEPQNTAGLVLSTLEYNLPKDYYSTYPERISKFTSAELMDVAKKVYPPEDLSIIVVGDASQVLPKLQRFGKVDVYDLDLKPKKNVEVKMHSTNVTVDEVLEKLYQGLNKPAYAALKNRKIEGTLSADIGGMTRKAKFEEIDAAPKRVWKKIDFGAPIVIETRVDGEHVYGYAPGQGGEVDPETAHSELGGAVFNEELHLKDPGYELKVLGIQAVPAGDAYVLDVQKPGKYHEKWYIDVKTGYRTRLEQIEGDNVSTQDFSDFRPVDGIPYAFKIAIHGGGDQTVELTSITHNVTVDDKMFMKK
ncbi:MAG: insulinase family protein [Bacteroidetes bacterium]|nr:insulinase family protein [Bacteroidota bacterium]